jgi:putative membrane protein
MTYSPPWSVVAGIVGLAVLYALAVESYRDRFPRSSPISFTRQAAFGGGIAVLFFALATPLDTLADEYLFTAHMIQHLLLTLIAAPLLIIGTPGWLLRSILKGARLDGFVRWARHPLPAFFIFNIIFAMAHVPSLYEQTLASPPLHAFEHLVFIATAMLMWMPVLSPVPEIAGRYPPLGQVLYLFLQTVPASLVGALLAATSVAYYPTYILAPRIVGLSPLEDQQLGGLIMWVGSGLFFLLISGVVFFSWANREEAANRRPLGVH